MKILILEDTRAMARALLCVLEQRFPNDDLELVWVQTVEEARAEIQDTDLLISDYRLVGETSAEFLDTYVAGNVAFLVLSSDTEFDFSPRVLKSALAILEKPLDAEVISPLVRAFIDQRSARD